MQIMRVSLLVVGLMLAGGVAMADPCPGIPSGSVVDRGPYAGQHYLELYSNFSSSNPSIGTYFPIYDQQFMTCAPRFTVGSILCNDVSVPVQVTYSSTSQINIALPLSSTERFCNAYSSSRNTQYILFNFWLPPDP